MSSVRIHRPTGALLIAGKRVFPIVLSNPPPLGSRAPNGRDGLTEVAEAGVSFIRTGRGDWDAGSLDQQLAVERERLDAAAALGLHSWLYLGDVPNLPPRPAGSPPGPKERLLGRIVAGLQGHPALAVYKGIDEPRNPFRGANWIRPAGLVRALQRVKAIDPDHPLAITQAPRGTVAQLTPYRPAFDLTGADIYPISYPPGIHAGGKNRDISVVGDVTKRTVRAAGAKPVWITLQIAWSGIAPSKKNPGVVPRFPSFHQERFMAYQAIVNGARGLAFFGGHMTQVMRPADAEAGWNWTFWERVLRSLVAELTSTAITPALVAPNAKAKVKSTAANIELVTRQEGGFLYVIAVRRGGPTSRVGFSGLPRKRNGRPITGGQVLSEFAQEPPPPPLAPGKQAFRSVAVSNGSFRDWFSPHDVHVYRFAI
jgi:hypothetical protein